MQFVALFAQVPQTVLSHFSHKLVVVFKNQPSLQVVQKDVVSQVLQLELQAKSQLVESVLQVAQTVLSHLSHKLLLEFKNHP